MRRPEAITTGMARKQWNARLWALAVFLLPAACCLLPAAAQAALISRSAEISLGRTAAQEYERDEAIDTDPVLAARVRRIGTRLIAAAGATEYPFEFHSVETNQINAFALPGGFVYIFRGLTQLVPGDDALAFIMAHEISHVTQRHGVHQIEKSLAMTAILDFALHRSAASGVLQLALEMHYSRQDEAEADRLGLDLMAKAGFDPSQGAEAMAVIARVAKGEGFLPPLLRSHPATETRIASLRRQGEALRAAPHPTRTVTVPPLPAPAGPPPPPATPAPSELLPLQTGMRWTYRVTGSPGRQAFTTSVLEERPGQAGVYRVRTDLDDDLAQTRLLAVTGEGLCAYPESAASELPVPPSQLRAKSAGDCCTSGWRVEIPLTASLTEKDSTADWETVRVPAGEFHAVRAVQRSPKGEPEATVWLAPEVGIVRRAWEHSGLVEELEAFHRPAPEGEKTEGAKARPH